MPARVRPGRVPRACLQFHEAMHEFRTLQVLPADPFVVEIYYRAHRRAEETGAPSKLIYERPSCSPTLLIDARNRGEPPRAQLPLGFASDVFQRAFQDSRLYYFFTSNPAGSHNWSVIYRNIYIYTAVEKYLGTYYVWNNCEKMLQILLKRNFIYLVLF